MRRISHLSSKGQITLPLEIRQRLGLQTGDQVEFSLEQGQTILRPARAAENPFARFAGALPGFSGSASGPISIYDQIHHWIRDLRDPDPNSPDIQDIPVK